MAENSEIECVADRLNQAREMEKELSEIRYEVERLAMDDPFCRLALQQGIPISSLFRMMHDRLKEMHKEIITLEKIAPRLYEGPGGELSRWDCPTNMIPKSRRMPGLHKKYIYIGESEVAG